MLKRIGVMDLGSNTARLIVMAYTPGECFKLTDEVSEVVRLAHGVSEDGRLQPKQMRRALEAVKMFSSFCRGTNTDDVIATATSATRDASNGAAFLESIRREAGVEMRVISGQEEARYGYLGAVNSLPFTDGCVVDIGGGSAQVSLVRGRRLERSFSAPAGAVRFTDRYVRSDPISASDFEQLERAADTVLDGAPWLTNAGGNLAGVGGTVRSLARIHMKLRRYPFDRVHGYAMDLGDLDGIVEQLRWATQREREQIPGLSRDRADVILAGAVVLRQIFRRGHFGQLLVSGSGLREGIFYEHFLEHQPEPLFEDLRGFSVLNLARQYDYEQPHAEQVRRLSLELFDQLAPLHRYGAWERELLGYAALIHDVGVSVGYYDHHKHSAYLVLNAALLGFSHREQVFLALLARAHRKGDIETAPFGQLLAPDDGERLARLAALLRIAEYLERSKSQVVQGLQVEIGNSVTVRAQTTGDAAIEIWEANRRAGLFRKAFGREITIS